MQQVQNKRETWPSKLLSLGVDCSIDAKTEKEVAAARKAITRLVQSGEDVAYKTVTVGDVVKIIRFK